MITIFSIGLISQNFFSRCFSDIGRSYQAGRATALSLADMCLSKALILHELMHALGMP